MNRGERPHRPSPLTVPVPDLDPAAETDVTEGNHEAHVREGIAVPDPLWELWERGWNRDPAQRPTMADIEKYMVRLCAEEMPLRLLSIGAFRSSIVN